MRNRFACMSDKIIKLVQNKKNSIGKTVPEK